LRDVDSRKLRIREEHFVDGKYMRFFRKSGEGHEKKGDEFFAECKRVQESANECGNNRK